MHMKTSNIQCLAKLSQVLVNQNTVTNVGKLVIDLHKLQLVYDSTFSELEFDAKENPSYINMYKKITSKGNCVS
jgi:hypothetical protein